MREETETVRLIKEMKMKNKKKAKKEVVLYDTEGYKSSRYACKFCG